MTLFLFFTFHQVVAQNQYYWSDNRKIELTEDQTAVNIHFLEKQQPAALEASLKRNKNIQSFEFQANVQRLLVHFNQKMTTEKVVESLNLKQEAIKSISYAQRLNDGFPLWLTHQIVLKMKRGNSISDLQQFLQNQKISIGQGAFDVYTILEMEQIEKLLPLANQVRESGLVEWCHPDFYAKKTKHIDPFYADQFQLNNTGQTIDRIPGITDIDCNAPEAWTITKGNSNLVVAVIDDGVEAHEDLVDNNGNSRVLEGYTPFDNGNGSPKSDGAHGQSCAGIIAASHNDLGVRGIAPNVQILPINIFAGSETIAQIANAINFARINNAAVLSNSWGYSTCEGRFDVFDTAITNAVNKGRNGKGSVVTFASGNSYGDCVEYPANLPNVIAVGAVTNRGVRSDYSNYGNTLDLVAPSNGASGVRTIDRMGNEGYAAGNYTGDFGGTSAACPVVSGVAALVISANTELTGAQLTSILLNTATDMGAGGRDDEYGYGRVNAYAAILAATGGASFGYCTAQGESVEDEWIASFQLGDYSNSSNAATYSDFTSEIISLEAGKTYPITITPGYSGNPYPDAVRVWIDYNRNENFESEELIFESQPKEGAVSGSIEIPANASGSTRLRVALKFEALPDACEIFEYGEVEDYSVRFQTGNDVTICNVPTNLKVENFEESNATLTWKAVSDVSQYDLRIRVEEGDWTPIEEIAANEVTLTNFQEGIQYEFSVRSRCGESNFSAYSTIFSFQYSTGQVLEYCNAAAQNSEYQWIDLVELNDLSNSTGDDGGYADYTNLTANIKRGATETIYISKGPNTDYTFNWIIYIDFNQNGTFELSELMVNGASDSNETLYAEIDIPTTALLGKTRMRILMKYNEDEDACGTFPYGEVEDYSVNIQAAGTNFNAKKRSNAVALNSTAVDNFTVSVFPNPSSDYIQLRSDQFLEHTSIRIVDNYGRVLIRQENWSNTEKINIQSLSAGFYFLIVGEKTRISFVKK